MSRSEANQQEQLHRHEERLRARRSCSSRNRTFPTAAAEGLDLIRETVELEPEAELRPKLRDLAVKFLVLREVEAHDPELPTGRAHGLAFGPNGHRLAVLSEDNEELAFWDVDAAARLSTLSLRADAGARSGSLASGRLPSRARRNLAATGRTGSAVPWHLGR